jgi:hypothetical protein
VEIFGTKVLIPRGFELGGNVHLEFNVAFIYVFIPMATMESSLKTAN